jgi:O-antigen/teichoic acid export membrane protein
MKTLGVILAGVAAYAITLILFVRIVGVPAKSDWYWFPFIASLATVAGLGMWRRGPLGLKLLGIFLCAGLVFAVDLAGVIWYSCAKGVCL